MSTAGLRYSAESTGPDQQLIAGRYRACERIGRGRLGEIFSAVDEGDEHLGVEYRVALQVIPEAFVRNNALFNRLNVGYSTLRKHSHPNIVQFRRFGRHGNRGYLAMELLDGASLRFVLDDAGMLPPDEVKPVIRSIAEALQFLHANGIMHGNLTARNVFITDGLEVRLLDVLPLGADQAIISGGATSSPFCRSSISDDVFGLACIAYEMLAGRHPYNHSSPAEARQAGLGVDRLTSMTDAEWSVLHQALSLDEHSRTPTVGDFVRSFGINGAERLRPSSPQPVAHGHLAMPAAGPAIARLPASPQAPQTTTPIPVADPEISIHDRHARTKPVQRPPRRRRALLLTMLLSLVLAWTYHGHPYAQFTTLIGYVDQYAVSALGALQNGSVETPTADTDLAVSTLAATVAGRSEATVDVAAIERTAAADADAVIQDASEITVAGAELANSAGLPASDLERVADDVVNAPATGPGETTAADVDRTPSGDLPQTISNQQIVSVSEGDSVARILAPPTGYSESPLVWWTSEHSARAGEDFVAVEQRALKGTTADGEVLLIPLVNDSLPEPPESFFVSIGFHDTRKGHIERVATVRVDIVDDD